ncbi:MAG: hypothetical protein V2A73_18350, partial [Pseudomonadota bacterium]
MDTWPPGQKPIRTLLAIVPLVLTLGVGARTVNASGPSENLSRARGEYERGEYQRTIDILYPLLYPRALFRNEGEIKEAHFLLGVSHFYLDQRNQAQRELTALLFLDPEYRLDPVVDSPDVYAFFEAIRKELREKLDAMTEQKRQEEARRRQPSREVVIERTYTNEPSWLNWLPFGLPQLERGDRNTGVLLLSLELSLGATSVGTFCWQLARF